MEFISFLLYIHSFYIENKKLCLILKKLIFTIKLFVFKLLIILNLLI